MGTPEERLEAMLDDGNHVRVKPRAVPERFGTLRSLSVMIAFLATLPWVCVGLVWLKGPYIGLSDDFFPIVITALAGAALVFSVGAVATAELIWLLVSVEHTLRVIAARLRPPS